jgi:uncharacterized spore protein YtfJ
LILNIQDPIKTTVEEIRKVLNIENVVGKTIETEDKLLIPVTRKGMGFGASMVKVQDNMSGTGAGGGIEPIAVIVVFKGVNGPEGVKVLSLKSPDPLSRLIREITNAVIKKMDNDRKMFTEMYKKRN